MTQDFDWLDEPLTFDDAAAFTPVPLAEIPVFDDAPHGVHSEGNGWAWHDTALIAVERVTPDGEDTEYAVSLVDLYAHAETGAVGGRTLEIGSSPDVDEMTALIETLNDDMREAHTLPFERADFVQEWSTERALELGTVPPVWSDASAGEIAAYEHIHTPPLDVEAEPTQPLPDMESDNRFREAFASSSFHLLEPVDPCVNYSFEVSAADPWTLELTADKWWLGENGRVGHESQTLKTYSLETMAWERDFVHEEAAADRATLHRVFQEQGLDAAMHHAEGTAVANGELQSGEPLFTDGPPDRFDSWREITNDETREMPAVSVPDDWETFVEAHTVDPPARERHYWQMHTVAVETPDGQPLGAALVVTEYPQFPPDFSGDLPDDAESRTLEMAHFADEHAARKFEAEFRSYLVPGMIDAPELAQEVAKLEGLSAEWIEMEGNTLTREADGWQVHDPHVERDAPNIDF